MLSLRLMVDADHVPHSLGVSCHDERLKVLTNRDEANRTQNSSIGLGTAKHECLAD
jgi:hypothetical protein